MFHSVLQSSGFQTHQERPIKRGENMRCQIRVWFCFMVRLISLKCGLASTESVRGGIPASEISKYFSRLEN